MTLGPEDLPEWASQEGLTQLTCACLNETYHLVFTADKALCVCSRCHAVMAEFTRPPGSEIGLHEPASLETGELPKVAGAPVGGVAHGAAWAGEGFGLPGERDTLAAAGWDDVGQPPPLLDFRSDQCNAYLRGGAYDGQLTWVMEDASMFGVRGFGVYARTAEVIDGRAVYEYQGGP